MLFNLKAPEDFASTALVLSSAFVLGGLIGLERQIRQRTAGLRTNVLVAVGSAFFVEVAYRFHVLHGGAPGALQVMAYVVSGVGFLGAGAILRDNGGVRGLNTAATLWCSAAVGVACGSRLYGEAALAAAFVLTSNLVLRPLVNLVNRQPESVLLVEAEIQICIVCNNGVQTEALLELRELLRSHRLPVADLDVRRFGEADVEIEVRLAQVDCRRDVLDKVVTKMRARAGVHLAFWTATALS